jgi:hypothetical protein
MRDHIANQGGELRWITLNDALGNEEFAILTVLGDRLEEHTDLILRRNQRSEASDHSLMTRICW